MSPSTSWRAAPAVRWCREHWVLLAWLGLVLVIVLPVGGWFALSGRSGGEVPRGIGPVHTVRYTVSGTGRADVTFSADGTRDVALIQGARLPWHRDMRVRTGPRTVYQLSARRSGGTGALGCAVTVDGKVVQRDEATGSDASVLCDTLP